MEEVFNNNLFNYATKELSQDAFICWLIHWINYEGNNEENNILKDVAKSFLDKMFSKENNKEYKNVYVDRQVKNIDILLTSLTHKIIIEDKTNCNVNESQMERYVEKVKEEYNDKYKIIRVFIKTIGVIDKLKREELEEKNIVIDRNDMLKVLEVGKNSKNNIYLDYYNRLQEIEDKKIKKEQIKDNLICLILNNTYRKCIVKDQSAYLEKLKSATSYIWDIGKEKRDDIDNWKYALAVEYGEVKRVYKITGYVHASELNSDDKLKIENIGVHKNVFAEIDGKNKEKYIIELEELNDDDDAKNYVGKNISDYLDKGQSSRKYIYLDKLNS